MKTLQIGIIISLWLLSSRFAFGQNINDTAKMNFIKAQYAEINGALKFYKKTTKEDTAESTEGNEISLFFKGDTIKKIRAIYYGETGKALTEYYFYNKRLIFYYFEEDRYDVPIYANTGKVKIASKKEKRYYLKDDKIFGVKLNPKETVSSKEFKELTINIQKEAFRLLHLK